MIQQPLVSIIIPVYNVEKYLSQCLESLINQTYSNLELIIINDGSPDSSHLIIDEFVKKDLRIKVVNQKNSGLSLARNAGVKYSTGEFIMFVDSDDWVDLNLVENLINHYLGNDIVLCSYMRQYDSVKIPRVLDLEGQMEGSSFQLRLLGLRGVELKDPSQIDSLSTAWGKLYKTIIIKEKHIKFLSTKKIGTEDLLFNIEYSNYVSSGFIVNKPLYNYRRNNETSFTSNYKATLFTLWQNLFSHLGKIISKKEAVFKDALNNRISLSIIGLGLNELQNPKGFLSAYKNIKLILNNKQFKKASANLELKYFSIHWWLFFAFAKHRFVFGVYLFLRAINYFVNKNK